MVGACLNSYLTEEITAIQQTVVGKERCTDLSTLSIRESGKSKVR